MRIFYIYIYTYIYTYTQNTPAPTHPPAAHPPPHPPGARGPTLCPPVPPPPHYFDRKTTYSNRKLNIIDLNKLVILYLFLIGPFIYYIVSSIS